MSDYKNFNEVEYSRRMAELEYTIRCVEEEAMKLRELFIKCIYSDGAMTWIEERDNKYLREVKTFESNLFDIKVSCEKSVMCISIPALMPHRKDKPNVIFEAALKAALLEFDFSKPEAMIEFRNSIKYGAVLVVHHSYGSRARVRDNDNIELKSVIDTLVGCGYLERDTGDYLSLYMTAKVAVQENSTHLYIMSNKDFKNFITNETE